MLKLIVGVISLMFLAGCSVSTIVTDTEQLDEYIEEQKIPVDDNLSIYFERDRYALDERDEVFFVVENHTNELIEINENYLIRKYEADAWVPVDNHALTPDNKVELSPGNSTEQIVWLSFGSDDFEKGIYQLSTTIHYPEQTDIERTMDPNHPEINEEIRLLFEMK